jgi:hypothetical protein
MCEGISDPDFGSSVGAVVSRGEGSVLVLALISVLLTLLSTVCVFV